MKIGMVQLYTGDGKGKTTAAAGLALRAMGSGWKVLFVQFMKSIESAEIEMLGRCGGDSIEIMREWDDTFVVEKPTPKQKLMCENLFDSMRKRVERWRPDMVVLDEVAVAIYFGLLQEERVLDFVKKRPQSLEVVMTGRNATDAMIEASDLVTRMEKVKHYYDTGVKARKGIEY